MNDQESERLAALRRYAILDSEAETDFDELVELAAAVCGTPISLVSLVDANRQWFKAKTGILVSETPRDVSFCAHAIAQRDIFIVEDATKDTRFCDNPIVRQTPHIRFYAGVPLMSDNGYALGALCVVDHVPRKLEMRQVRALEILGRQAQALLDRHLCQRKLSAALEDGAGARRAFQIEHSRLQHVTEEQKIGWFEWAGEMEGLLSGGKFDELIGAEQGGPEHGISRLVNHVHPDDSDSLLAALGAALNSVEPMQMCFRSISADGSARWLHCVAHGVPPLAMRSARLFGTVREITGVIELQSRLERKRAVLQTVTELLPIAIAYISATRVVQWANEHYAKRVGQAPIRIIGRKLEEILSPQQLTRTEDSVARVLGGHQVFLEEHFVGADFKTTTWEKHLVPRFNGEGAVEGYVLIARDISSQAVTREGDESRGRRLREVIDKVPAMIWVSDAQASNNYVSAEFLRFCGWSFEDLLGHAWENLVHPEDAEAVVAERRAAIKNKRDFAVQYRMRRADGEYCRVLDLGRPVVDAAGSGWEYFGTCVPLESAGQNAVTVESGGQARATEPTKDSGAAFEPWAAMVAHDLRVPLHVITGFAALAIQDVERLANPELLDYLQRIEANAGRMNEMIEAMLRLGLESDLRAVPTLFPIRTLVAEVLDDLETERINRNIRFKVDVRGYWITDRPLLRQAIFNLLQNAIKFTRCRNPANIAIYGGDSALGYELSIVDNGIGFDPAQSHRLFKLFQRLNSTRDIEGVGVGLAVVRKIVESLGGNVSATPVAPHGACFVLKLPKMQVAA